MGLSVLGIARIRRAVFSTIGIVVIHLLLTAAAAAQQVDAGIIGQVRDDSGAVLPGVTVTVKGPALLVPEVVAVTDGRGEYRITPLPIGVFSVEYALPGFQGHRQEDLRLTVGFVAKLDIVLKVGSLEESVTVSGASPVVDVTATNASTQLTRETLDILPGDRSLHALVAMAPGARSTYDVGGAAATEQPYFRAFGQGGDAWPTIEGIVVGGFNNPNNGAGNYGDYASFEESRVSTLGNGPEMPGRGMQLITVVKSGGNDFHGSGDYKTQPPGLVKNNVGDLKQQYPNLNTALAILRSYDMGAELGGRIIRNKMWFYGAVRQRQSLRAESSGTMPDGRPAENSQTLWSRSEKVSYQLSKANKLVAYDSYTRKWDVSGLSDLTLDFAAKNNKPTPMWSRKIEWQSVIGSSVVASLQQGYYEWGTHYGQVNTGPYGDEFPIDVTTMRPSYTDTFLTTIGGEGIDVGRWLTEWRHHTTGKLSWYRPDAFHGNHNIQVGGDYIHSKLNQQYQTTRQAGNYQLRFRNKVANQVEFWQEPADPVSITNYVALYAGDSWTIARRLTLNLGVRYERNAGNVPPGCTQPFDIRPGLPFTALPTGCNDNLSWPTWNALSPRLHAAFDLTGDGKNVIKGGWGHFQRLMYGGDVLASDPKLRAQVRYRWRDTNNNGDWDPGESNLDLNGSDFVQITGGATRVVNPDLVQPSADEWSTSFERQLGPDFGVRATGVYSKLHNPFRLTNLLRPYSSYNIPITNKDPGPDGVLGTGDDTGQSITYYEYPVSLQPASFNKNTYVNETNVDVHYTSFELALSKRMSHRWLTYASYSFTKRHVPTVNSQSEQNSDFILAVDNPNAQFNTSDFTSESTGKISGAYTFPYAILASFGYETRSGTPWARTVEFTGGTTIPTIVLPVEAIGARRMPRRNLTNASVQKDLRLGGSRSLQLRANLYNVINSNAILSVTQQSGPQFLIPSPGNEGFVPAIMQPRVVELSATFKF